MAIQFPNLRNPQDVPHPPTGVVDGFRVKLLEVVRLAVSTVGTFLVNLFVTGTARIDGKVGIGENASATTAPLHVIASGTEVTTGFATVAILQRSENIGDGCGLEIISGEEGNCRVILGHNLDRNRGQVHYNNDLDEMNLNTNGVVQLTIDDVGNVTMDGLFTSGKQVKTLGVADDTFAVVNNMVVLSGDASENNILTITGGPEGVEVRILFEDSLVSIIDDSSGDPNTIDLFGNGDFQSLNNATLTIMHDGTSWHLVSASPILGTAAVYFFCGRMNVLGRHAIFNGEANQGNVTTGPETKAPIVGDGFITAVAFNLEFIDSTTAVDILVSGAVAETLVLSPGASTNDVTLLTTPARVFPGDYIEIRSAVTLLSGESSFGVIQKELWRS